jgi:hypothetical protein
VCEREGLPVIEREMRRIMARFTPIETLRAQLGELLWIGAGRLTGVSASMPDAMRKDFEDELEKSVTKVLGMVYTELDRMIDCGVKAGDAERELLALFEQGLASMSKLTDFYRERLDVYTALDGGRDYQFTANIREATCRKCREANGKVMTREVFAAQGLIPPLHPNCGCVIGEVRSVPAAVPTSLLPEGGAAGDKSGGSTGLWQGIKDVAGQVGSGMASAVMGSGIGLSGIISGVTNIFVPFVRNNYDFNSQFVFNDFIHGQGLGDAAKMKMGHFEGWYNGCGWISVYNASLLIGKSFQPADIIRYFDGQGGTLINGAFGINPLSAQIFLRQQGIDADIYNLPQVIDDRIKESTASILLYAHRNGAHYVMIEYVNGEFLVYNERPGDKEPRPYPSIEDWLNGKRNMAISLITLP